MRLYSIFDRIAEEFGPVFEAKNDSVAIRNWRNTLERAEGVREDEYRLYWIGTIDHSTGKIVPTDIPAEVMTAVALNGVAV